MKNGTVMVVGKAMYKGRTYYVRWSGRTRTGKNMARLISYNGQISFWVNLSGPGEYATITKYFNRATSLQSIRDYVEEMKENRMKNENRLNESNRVYGHEQFEHAHYDNVPNLVDGPSQDDMEAFLGSEETDGEVATPVVSNPVISQDAENDDIPF